MTVLLAPTSKLISPFSTSANSISSNSANNVSTSTISPTPIPATPTDTIISTMAEQSVHLLVIPQTAAMQITKSTRDSHLSSGENYTTLRQDKKR